jgi:hypothetical protein
VLLSGGLIFISAIERDYWRSKGKTTFIFIGLDADVWMPVAARKVADFATEHHEILFSVEEWYKNIR